MIDPVGFAERHWGIALRKSSRYEWVGPCPWCGDGGKGGRSDRFHIFTDKSPRYWCRMCNAKGFLETLDGHKPTPEELLELRVRRLEQQQKEQAERLTALEKMHQCHDHICYHQSLSLQEREYWYGEGVFDQMIDQYQLGYCLKCPTYPPSASYTIPVLGHDGQLENIRHRLKSPNGKSGKYRPHVAGLGTQLFNAPLLAQPRKRIIVVEGAKKAIVLSQAGFPAVAVMGKNTFRREWLGWFESAENIVIALDPDATKNAHCLGALFNRPNDVRIAHFPVKPDDAIVKMGAGNQVIETFLSLATPVRMIQ